MAKFSTLLSAVMAMALSLSTSAFTTCSNAPTSPIILEGTTTTLRAETSRRSFFAATAAVAVLSPSLPTSAAANSPPTPEELARIKTGYNNIQFLLANWEKETTVCRENGGECKRDADPVRKYLGLRSTTDPLFQIEKVFNKVKYMDNIDVDKLDDFFEATEDW
jgi:hypothetical protein